MGGSDKRLVRRAVRGDGRAFEEIYRRYEQDLYRFCLAMTGNHPDAQDALQNTMVKVLRGLPGEERQIVLKPWLYRIARNETIDVLRKRRDNEELGVAQTDISTVAETAEIREHLRMLLGDLEQLPQRQRAVLLMRELSGLGFAEIGIAFGTSAAAVRQTLYEARLNLQQLQEGRERRCVDVQRELSDADGRVIRRRKTRAHLRHCRECRTFQHEIVRRQKDLAAITAFPLAAAAGAGHAVATSTLVKSAATLAVAALAVSAVDHGALIDLHLGDKGEAVQPAFAAPQIGREPTRRNPESVESDGSGAAERRKAEPGGRSGVQGQASLEAQPAEAPEHSAASAEPVHGYDEAPAAEDPDAVENDPQPAATQEDPVEDDPAGDSSHFRSHGQLTAAAHRSPQAASPPGHGPPAEKPGKPRSDGDGPPGKAKGRLGESEAPPAKAEADEAEAPSEQVSPASESPGKSGEAGHGHSNPGHGPK
jgi:RNA polymerase sigma factor (sigma-70 family)